MHAMDLGVAADLAAGPAHPGLRGDAAADDQRPGKKLRRSNARLDLGALLAPETHGQAADEGSDSDSMPGLVTAPPSSASSLTAPAGSLAAGHEIAPGPKWTDADFGPEDDDSDGFLTRESWERGPRRFWPSPTESDPEPPACVFRPSRPSDASSLGRCSLDSADAPADSLEADLAAGPASPLADDELAEDELAAAEGFLEADPDAGRPTTERFLREAQAKTCASAYHQLRRRQLELNLGQASGLQTVYGPVHGPVSWQGSAGPTVCVWPWRSGFAYVLAGKGKAKGYFNLCLTKRAAAELADQLVSAHALGPECPQCGRPSKLELRESAFGLYVSYWPRLPENGLEVPGPLGQA